MRNLCSLSLILLIGFGINLSLLCPPLIAQGQDKEVKEGNKVGERASDFSLPDTNSEAVKLSSFKGDKNIERFF